MPHKPPLHPGGYYHIYNRGLNKATLFSSDVDFKRFLYLIEVFLCPVSEVLSYALIRNHFHIALRVKTEDEIGWLLPENSGSIDPAVKWSTTFDDLIDPMRRKPDINFMLRHLLGAYSKWFNKRYQRSGKLFEERHERKPVYSDDYLRELIIYINRNPERHGVVKDFRDYPWTSFHALTSGSAPWLTSNKVIELFGDRETFMLALQKKDFDEWLELEN